MVPRLVRAAPSFDGGGECAGGAEDAGNPVVPPLSPPIPLSGPGVGSSLSASGTAAFSSSSSFSAFLFATIAAVVANDRRTDAIGPRAAAPRLDDSGGAGGKSRANVSNQLGPNGTTDRPRVVPACGNGGGDFDAIRRTGGLPDAIASEGWLQLFLTAVEKSTFGRWREAIRGESLPRHAAKALVPDDVAPNDVAPNVVAAAGLACLVLAWCVQNLYRDAYPTACAGFAVVSVLISFATSGVAGRHTDRLCQRSGLGKLFEHSCDGGSGVFFTALATGCLGAGAMRRSAGQLTLFAKHLTAFLRKEGMLYGFWTASLALRVAVGLDRLVRLNEVTNSVPPDDKYDVEIKDNVKEIITDPHKLGSEIMQMLYACVYLVALRKTLLLRREHNWTKFRIIFCLTMRLIPAVFLRWGYYADTIIGLTAVDVVVDGLFLTLLTSDVTLAKMAGREIHSWVVLMSPAVILGRATIILLITVNYVAIFADLSAYLNMPLMIVCCNAYCDGVYDLCHIGHTKHYSRTHGLLGTVSSWEWWGIKMLHRHTKGRQS
ncbi:LOW QUALITY PROTEIN: hypothetical protein ACHAWF_015632 [Thalassiosira exigua]